MNDKITSDKHTYYIDGDYSGYSANGSIFVENTTYMREDLISECFVLKVRWDKPGGKINLTSLNENEISIRTVQEYSENENIKITLQYPQIDRLTRPSRTA
ncbi:MAG: Copper amine oxidase-like domain-containing protein [Desulfotomaculum sp. 46_296]|nr:MAG: Copper amine oxidase-like domain-containing protein [Desulfotomaculum sp. 46_296]HAU32057.1 hypothetical protein [Desulfotomaculum sp.]